GLAAEMVLFRAHERMDDRFEFLQRVGMVENARCEPVAVDAPIDDDAGKRGLDGGHGHALIQPMHGGIGVEHRHALSGEHFRGRRFAHGGRTREAEHDHLAWPFAMSASTASRSAGVTFGFTPKNFSKAGTAWCSSMPRPSTVRRPRARAAASSGVSSGT